MKNQIYHINYRNEFGATIKAKDMAEAIKKFETNKCKIECIGNLWPDYFEVIDGNGDMLKEMGD